MLRWSQVALGWVTAAISCAPRTPSRSALAPTEAEVATSSSVARAVAFSVERLPVEGHGDALVVVPPRGSRPRPLLIAAGGAGDTPEWECRAWARLVADRAFVVCVRGLPLNPRAPEPEQRYYFKDHFALENELFAAVAALQRAFGAEVDVAEPVYAGFSQGATMGALVIRRHPARFPRAILIEGGIYDWTSAAAVSYRRGGGKRVLFACGQAGCLARAGRSRDEVERSGVSARAVFGEAGHTYEGAVADALEANLPWLVDGAAGWETAR